MKTKNEELFYRWEVDTKLTVKSKTEIERMFYSPMIIPLSSLTCVKSTSLNPPSWYIRAADLKSALWQENKDRRLQGMVQLSPNEFTKFKYGISLKDYLSIEVSRLTYYNRKHK